jgi:hypothetical protein
MATKRSLHKRHNLFLKKIIKLIGVKHFVAVLGKYTVLKIFSKKEVWAALGEYEKNYLKAFSKKKKVPLKALRKQDILNALQREVRRRVREHLAALSREELLSIIMRDEELQKALLEEMKPEQARKLHSEIECNKSKR